ncbi:TetR/AcrR family transcriptional regulator [Candidatus Poriferisocius sp.]|uniref:TetR/AcrR family transcriptional regulator n=1 Tax=Candidatus Poriferisocius sp. TaxID=3101276 RepID=UPI003B5BF4B6
MTAFADPPITAKAEATRSHLLGLATELFVRRGYAAVTLDDIAGAAELTKGAIYGHFRSKGQLLVEVIRRLQGQLDDNIRFGDDYQLFLRPESADLRLLLVDAASAARHDPDVAAGIEEIYSARNRWLLDNLAHAYHDPDTVLFIISALSNGIGVEEAFARPTPSTDVFRRTLHTMLDAVVKKPA